MTLLHWFKGLITQPSPSYTWELFRAPVGFVRRIYRPDGTHLIDVPLRTVTIRGERTH